MKKIVTDPTAEPTLTDADKVTTEFLFSPSEDGSPIPTPNLEEKEMSPKTPKPPGLTMSSPMEAPKPKTKVISMRELLNEFPDDDLQTSTKPPPARARAQAQARKRRSWLLPIAGAVTFFILLAVIGGVAWWFNAQRAVAPAPVEKIAEAEAAPVEEPVAEAAIDENNDPATMTEADVEEGPEMGGGSGVDPFVAAPVVASSASPTLEPTNCTFLNGNRPQVAGKYVLTCIEGTFLAAGEYKGGGVFAFSAYEPHNPSK